MDEAMKYFNTKNEIISKSTDLDAWYDETVKDQLLVIYIIYYQFPDITVFI